MSKIALSGNASGTGTFTIASPNSNTDRTLNLPDNSGTVLTTASNITAQALSGPTFRAQKTTEQVPISISAWNKVTWPVESWDVGPCFDTTNSRFQPSVAGYYQVNAMLVLSYSTGGPSYWQANFYKNGSAYGPPLFEAGDVAGITLSDMVYMNGSTDYVEVFVRPNGGGTVGVYPSSCFSGALVRSAA
jgi:hypothetical protein